MLFNNFVLLFYILYFQYICTVEKSSLPGCSPDFPPKHPCKYQHFFCQLPGCVNVLLSKNLYAVVSTEVTLYLILFLTFGWILFRVLIVGFVYKFFCQPLNLWKISCLSVFYCGNSFHIHRTSMKCCWSLFSLGIPSYCDLLLTLQIIWLTSFFLCLLYIFSEDCPSNSVFFSLLRYSFMFNWLKFWFFFQLIYFI